jgi:hypothetical protein
MYKTDQDLVKPAFIRVEDAISVIDFLPTLADAGVLSFVSMDFVDDDFLPIPNLVSARYDC